MLIIVVCRLVYSWKKNLIKQAKVFFRSNESYIPHHLLLGLGCMLSQGAKKIIFTACHSGKLKLEFTSPNVILTVAPKTFWLAELISQFFLKTEFTSPIAKSTSPGLSDTTFFARCVDTLVASLHWNDLPSKTNSMLIFGYQVGLRNSFLRNATFYQYI